MFFNQKQETAKEKALRLIAEDRARIAREWEEDAPKREAWEAEKAEMLAKRSRKPQVDTRRHMSKRQWALFTAQRGKRGGRFITRISKQTGMPYRHYI